MRSCVLRAHAVASCQYKRETIKEIHLSLVDTSVSVHRGRSVRGRVRPRQECRTCCLLRTSVRPCSRPPFVGLLRRTIAISKVRVYEGETARGRVDVPTASRLRYLLWRNTFHVGRVSDVSNVKCRVSATHRLGTTGMRFRGGCIHQFACEHSLLLRLQSSLWEDMRIITPHDRKRYCS